jgi:hypothetical protein
MRVLAISHDATEAIRQIITSSELPQEGGIRLSVESIDEQRARLDVSLAQGPEPGNPRVEEEVRTTSSNRAPIVTADVFAAPLRAQPRDHRFR